MTIQEYIEELINFAIFVAKEIFEEDWETNNKEAFTEITCRKLTRHGLVKKKKNEYIFEDKDETIR